MITQYQRVISTPNTLHDYSVPESDWYPNALHDFSILER
jgi:hypothetical protein